MENDRLAVLAWLIPLRGLRRGEAAALDRDDLDSKARELTISRQLIALLGSCTAGRRSSPVPKRHGSQNATSWPSSRAKVTRP